MQKKTKKKTEIRLYRVPPTKKKQDKQIDVEVEIKRGPQKTEGSRESEKEKHKKMRRRRLAGSQAKMLTAVFARDCNRMGKSRDGRVVSAKFGVENLLPPL